jgi:hypothetical protein
LSLKREGTTFEKERKTMKNQDTQIEFEEPPGHGRPPHPWEDVPLAQWNDWRWQLSHRLNTVEDFVQVIHLTPEEVEGLSAPGLFRVDAHSPVPGSVHRYPDRVLTELQVPVFLNTEGER